MKYIVANWKMNKTIDESVHFMEELTSFLKQSLNKSICSVFVAPPAIHIPLLVNVSAFVSLTGQNVSSEDFGAYTGELSAVMLSQYVKYVIVGHSERRKYFNETNQILYKKLSLCFQYKMRPIFCVGEKKEDRNSGDYLSIIKKQLQNTIMLLPDDDLHSLIIAYEPIWAIGTGQTASLDQIEEVHSYIKDLLVEKTGDSTGRKIPVLYGGSCTAKNARSILIQNNVDGLLVGGASLDFSHFQEIIEIAHKIS